MQNSLPQISISLASSGIAVPEYLWESKPLERFICPVSDESGAAVVLRGLTSSQISALQHEPLSKSSPQPYRLLDRNLRSYLEIVPSGAAKLSALPDYFHKDNDGLQYAFGLAVSHAFANLGASLIHAAAFEIGSTSLLVLGPGRSGKSTLTALALRRGARVYSDDTLLLRTCSNGYAHLEAIKPNLLFRDPTPTLLPDWLQCKLEPLLIRGERRCKLNLDQNSLFYSTRPTVFVSSQIVSGLEISEIQPMKRLNAMAEVMRSVSPLFLTSRFTRERAVMMPAISALALGTPSYNVKLGQDIFKQPDVAFNRLLDALS